MVKKTDDPKSSALTQLDKFKDAAREVGTDDSEEHFDRTLTKVAKASSAEKKARAKVAED